MNYIITKHPEYFQKIGQYAYCNLEDMVLTDTIAIDTETTGLTARYNDIFCVQIGTGTNNYIVQLYDDNYSFNNVIPYIKDKVLIGHNIKFDLEFFYKYNFFPENVLDTMLASKILYNGDVTNMRNDFATVMERELGIIYDKTDQKNIHLVKLSQASTIKYSFNDVDRLIELHTALLKKINAKGYSKTYALHCRFIRALAYMEQCDLPISPDKWKTKMVQDIEATKKWKTRIEEYIYDNIPNLRDNQIDMFNPDLYGKKIHLSIQSPKQMLKVFEFFNIPTKDKEGKDSINENIINKSKHEFVEIWLKFQNAHHRVTTFGNNIYQQIENDRIYTEFNPMVDTARLSSYRGAINFLNFPADEITRSCFVANPGNVMIVSDWSGQETVIAADLSGDDAMTKSVVEGADLHSLLARILFPELALLTDEEIMTEHYEKRKASKAPRFAMQYGGNAYTLHVNEGISMKRATAIEIGFKELHAGLYKWGAEVFKKAVDRGYIESVDGWKLRLPKFEKFLSLRNNVNNITSDDWTLYKIGKIEYKEYMNSREDESIKKEDKYTIKDKEAYNYYKSIKKTVSGYFKLRAEYQRLCLNNPVQTRGAHQLKLAVSLVFEWILKNNLIGKVLICNSPHDEIVLESNLEYAPITRKALEECMIEGGNYYLSNLTIKADANIGNSWYEAK